MYLTVLPQGWTGSVGIFQNDVALILQNETSKAPNFLDDITLLGPKTQYQTPDGTYETISENPDVRRFIWEHAVNLNRVLHRLVHAGATVSAKKLQLCHPEIIVVGRRCTYEGQGPDATTVEVLKWPECQNVSEVRGFLGMTGTVRNWVKTIRPVDHSLPFPIILSVDTVVIAVGFILAQLDGENQRRPARFGSIT
ncbi:Gag-Pol polyprotein [Leucoagaricus sp. SymC.cos]|nr:Gag-Pol polyprotein [Leucoagaricus sp. SymC.cos]